jgi:hypothetical protein
MTSIELVSLPVDLEQQYRQFLLSNPRALIYATLEYRNFLSAVAGGAPDYWLAIKHDQIMGAIPFFSKAQAEYGTVINSLPWYGSYGACTLAPIGDASDRQALLVKYAEAALAPDTLTATLILSPFENQYLDQYLHVLKPDSVDHRIGQITPLPKDIASCEEHLLGLLKHKTRNLVRKSLKQGFQLLITDENWAWQFLYETHVENMQAIGGRAKPWEHFLALREYIPIDWRSLFLAVLDGQPVAAMLLLYFNKTVEYITPVVKHEYRSQQPLSFLIWHGMLRAVRDGFWWWNWGGTWISQKSLYHFKSGWGADDYPYTYLINVGDGAVPILKSDLEKFQTYFSSYYLIPYGLLQQAI